MPGPSERRICGWMSLQHCGMCSRGTQTCFEMQPSECRHNSKHRGKRSQMLSKLTTEMGASQTSATSLHTLPAFFLQQQTPFLSISCMLILTHTGGFDCTQQNPAAQQAPLPDSRSSPPLCPSGMGCLASLHSPQTEFVAPACRWALLSVDQALWPPPPSDS